ncbi:MAG: hypothetical protein A2233_00340 [Candidatus Kerfeldbacteria bacterium RIFOXYA2_FULL_38_24]|uniref:Glycosyltransferase 2-like domain-containing protein n=1 Tax=Candidatus Kerfeldbacteria bacterium RIFOXYB2_FULL_38_14 TaxID=1798547 RepID=A0A1G2BA38_9BACT|nr:MAG: hypothetical protein A2233_00340 [Candidatus Kerfeldbacteria bacterium RIFOXYA2_FULL_38_24]OGY86044.1 MAG: hypothetical protein A2319_00545 [Candidatus Kerfeldbacteria bacterium RIFOXYB2_FULL_38_14]OGY90160.1 MAG: hypothetical protein A2458_04800 [Candidatus Kerfeldbacteria bacterium RIFOXYC2_FULL_38_9]
MNKPEKKLAVIVVLYNGEKYIPNLCATLKKQTETIDEVIVVDNSPNNLSAEIFKNCYPQAVIYKQQVNLDFCRGYNFGLQKSHGDYLLILNQDLILAENAMFLLKQALVKNPNLGAVSPKLYCLQAGQERSIILDSMGIFGTKARCFYNLGEGKQDHNQYQNIAPFGISGTAILFRKEALIDIALNGGGEKQEYFDADFVAYKDDIDLAYRLRHRNWQIALVPEAVMYHERKAQELKATKGVFKDRQLKSWRIRSNSWRNHLWVLLKNEPWENLLRHSPWILWYELKKIIFILFFEPSTLRCLPSFFKGLKKMLKKRRAILNSSEISAQQLRKSIIY